MLDGLGVGGFGSLDDLARSLELGVASANWPVSSSPGGGVARVWGPRIRDCGFGWFSAPLRVRFLIVTLQEVGICENTMGLVLVFLVRESWGGM